MLRRLDAELVRRKLAKSREDALNLISAKRVRVAGVIATKAAKQVSDSESIAIVGAQDTWVSRGAYKLLGAIEAFANQGLTFQNRQVLDAGASTGGFTQVCLHHGAARVAAVDVGYGQLAWQLRQDERVFVLDRFNIRNLQKSDVPFTIDLVVADLSFISLKTVLPNLRHVVEQNADLLLMVKPQFEVGKDLIGEGVVTDPNLRFSAVFDVVQAAQSLEMGLMNVTASPLPGPSGNVEYFVWLRVGAPNKNAKECADVIHTAIAEGPA